MLKTLERISWEAYESFGQRMYVKPKTVIYKEKEKSCNGFYYLKEGLIRISTTNHSKEERIIDIVSSGKSFGEQSVDDEIYFSTATALVGSIIYFFPEEQVNSLLEEDEEFRLLFYNGLTEKLQILSNNILCQTMPTEKLLADKLLTLYELFKSNNIPFTQVCVNLFSVLLSYQYFQHSIFVHFLGYRAIGIAWFPVIMCYVLKNLTHNDRSTN